MKEIWKYIPGYEGLYKISNYGSIYAVKCGKIRKLRVNKDGYYIVILSKNDKKKSYLVHRLVAEAFIDKKNCKKWGNDNIYKYILVNHKDENKLNNKVDNLEWCTNKYNVMYSKKSNAKKLTQLMEYMERKKLNKSIREDIISILIS